MRKDYREHEGQVYEMVQLTSYSYYDLEGTYDEVLAKLMKERDYFTKDVPYFKVELSVGNTCGDGDRLYVVGWKLVTGTELETYRARQRKEEETRLQYRKTEYERLRKEFGG